MSSAPLAIGSAEPSFSSQDGRVIIHVRQASHPAAVKRFDTAELRAGFLIETLFASNKIVLTYSHIDRLVVGGAMPGTTPLLLEALKPIGTTFFLERREIGIVNIGAPGSVIADGKRYALDKLDALYLPMGTKDVQFESADAALPAKFYLVSTPAHAAHPAQHLKQSEARKVELGAQETCNQRTIFQYIHPDIMPSCQLVMGLTLLKPGSIWNTMPCHVHDRRSEAYLYFDVPDTARIFHLMGEPHETRHLVLSNEQAILCPGWSIHSGVGTANYGFIWAMGGDNQSFTDMDHIAMSDLR